jgi:AhpD family alkylhydroperoxidase
MRPFIFAAFVVLSAAPALGADPYEEALAEVKATFGIVPSFMATMSRAALPGAWAEMKGVLLDEATALPPKTKALIAVGVGAAIGCEACVWMDSAEALRRGATEEELREAISVAAVEQHWNVVIKGAQIDLATLKAELGGE